MAQRTPLLQGLGVALALLATACAPMRQAVEGVASTAFASPEQTRLGQAFAAAQGLHPGQSGFRLLNNGVSALMTRAAMADSAQRAIDVQTFIFDADETGAFVLDHLLQAARRGVRVRLLLDDYELGLSDAILARLNAEPNMEVRLFNPLPDRARWSRPLQMLLEMSRLGRRMHNKVLVVDGQVAVLGGRNIGNHYFEGPSESNFRDIELQISGPVAAQAAQSFDQFWNSALVRPAHALGPDGTADEDLAALLGLLNDEHGPAAEYGRRRDEFLARVASPEGLIWAKGEVVAEPPVRQAEGAAKPSSEIARAHAIARQAAQREVIYEAAYFIPGDKGVAALGAMTARGVAVTVLTNSLGSTDVVAAHGAYAPYRPALLERGVALFEYRMDARRPEPGLHRLRKGRSDSGLHAKIAVYDRQRLWVGSANFDPRSRALNTEIGVMVESPELSEKILAGIAPDFAPSRAWRLAPGSGPAAPLVWEGEENGALVRHEAEPDGNPWRGLKALLYGLLPGVEDLL